MRPSRLLERILRGDVRNVDFGDLVTLLDALGFRGIGGRGSRVFARPDVAELVILQETRGEAKPYQVRQVATLVRRYHFQTGGKAMTSYPIEVFWSDEDQTWIADVPDLRFCTAHGPTPQAAVAEVEVAIEAWISAARQSGCFPSHRAGPRRPDVIRSDIPPADFGHICPKSFVEIVAGRSETVKRSAATVLVTALATITADAALIAGHTPSTDRLGAGLSSRARERCGSPGRGSS